MGRKTKKQKILAEQRRKEKSLLSQPTVTTQRPIYTPIAKDQIPTALAKPQSSPLASDGSDYSYVLSDLRRIGILTALAICAQLVLWYVVRK